MPIHTYRFTASIVFAALSLSCLRPEGRDSGPVAEASGPDESAAPASMSDVPVEALGSLEKIYVPLQGSSLQSLDDALAEKGYGNVMGSDFRPQFEHVETPFGPAAVAYSSVDWIERQSMFQPMSVTQWLEAALADSEAQGIIINPGHPGQILALTKTEIVQAMVWLPKQDALPMEISVTQ